MPEWRGHLAGPNCHAVVVGTGRTGSTGRTEAGAGPPLAGLPGAVNSARELARLLRERCGMADRVTEVLDPESPTDVLAALRTAVERSEGGVVLFCFTGHGLLGPGRRLYLATARTAGADDTVDAVPYDEVRNLLGDAAARAVVVLDCCFSGRAGAARNGSEPSPYASARPDGSFLLASATHYAASFAPVGEEFTLFGGELVRLLSAGDPGGPKWFTLLDLYRALDRRFRNGPARPHAEGVGLAGDLVLTRNPGHLATDPADGADRAAAGPGAGGPCPYPGMRPFLPEQHHLFFGREELVRRLVDRVTGGAAGGEGPVVLVGASGSGKSSLLRAGLVAGLEARGAGRTLLVDGPGARPFHTLVERWSQAVGRPFSEVERELGAGRFGPGGPEVLVVDQLEEVFTHCEDPEERELFVRAVTGPDPSAGAPRLVLGLRADFYAPCLRDARLARIVRAGQFTVPAMTGEELRAAVERPAAHAGLRLEEGLVEHLLRELSREAAADGDSVALPFLAHALRQTWARRRGTLLTFSGYEASGGIRGSVARVADELHDALDAPGRARLRELLLRMVTLVDADGRAARRRVPVPEADGDPGDGADRELLGRLADARLVVLDRGEAQLCHDSLLHGWPRLRDWIRDDRVGLLVRRRLGDAADSWDEAGRRNSGLYRGDQLATARSLLGGPGPSDGGRRDAGGGRSTGGESGVGGERGVGGRGRLGGGRGLGGEAPPAASLRPVERDFLRASARGERRSRLLRGAVVSVVAVLALLAGLLAVAARGAQRDAEAREAVAVADQLASRADALRDRDPGTALRLSLAAYRIAETSGTRSSLYASALTRAQVDLPGDGRGPVLALAYGPDGGVLAVSRGRDRTGAPEPGTDTGSGNAPAPTGTPAPDAPASTPTPGSARVRLWDVSRPAAPEPGAVLEVPNASPVAFHPRSPLLAVLSEGALTLWDTEDPRRPQQVATLSFAPSPSFSLAFSPDGRTLAAGGAGGRLRLWDVSAPARPRPLSDLPAAAESDLTAVSFHHDGRFLATGNGAGEDGEGRERPARVRLWDLRRPERPVLLDRADADSVMAAAFHPERDLLVATGGEGAMAWWTVEEGRRLVRVPVEDPAYENAWGYGSDLPSLAFRPDGGTLAAADVRGARVRVVGARTGTDLSSSRAGREPLPGAEPVRSVAYSPDGAYLAAGDAGGGVRLWPARAPSPALGGTVYEGVPGAAPYSRDGRLVLTREDAGDPSGGTSRVWDTGTADPAEGTPPRPLLTLTRPWEAGFFLPGRDRPFLMAHRWTEGSPDHVFRAWDLGGGGRPVPGAEIRVRAGDVRTAVSPDGKLLVIGSNEDPRAEVWDLADPLRPVSRAVITVTPSLDAMLFLGPDALGTTEDDGGGGRTALRLWDLSDPAHPFRVPEPLRGAAGGSAVHVRSTGTLFTDGTAETAAVWDVRDVRRPKLLRSLPAAPGGYLPVGGGLLATTLRDGTVHLWDMERLSAPGRPEPRITMRFDREITGVAPGPDGDRVLTKEPYRIWATGADGRWLTPAVATLEAARSVTLLPEGSPFDLVVTRSTGTEAEESTYLLDRDTDRLYARLCAARPSDVGAERWRALFSHIAPRPSC